MTLDEAAQAALDKVLYAQAVHMRDAHSGELTQSCSTCVALSDAVAACRVAGIVELHAIAVSRPESPVLCVRAQ